MEFKVVKNFMDVFKDLTVTCYLFATQILRLDSRGRDMAPHLKQHGALELRRSGAFSNSKLG